jgi:hypothetical protein
MFFTVGLLRMKVFATLNRSVGALEQRRNWRDEIVGEGVRGYFAAIKEFVLTGHSPTRNVGHVFAPDKSVLSSSLGFRERRYRLSG